MELIYPILIAALSVAAAIALFLGSVVGAVAIGLLKDEASAWLPTLTNSIVSLAVTRMDESERERYAEEWSAHILQYPGKLAQLVQALKCLSAGHKLSATSRKSVISFMSKYDNFFALFFGSVVGIASIKWPILWPIVVAGVVIITVSTLAFSIVVLVAIRQGYDSWQDLWVDGKRFWAERDRHIGR